MRSQRSLGFFCFYEKHGLPRQFTRLQLAFYLSNRTLIKLEIFNALTFSELIFRLLTPKILTDLSPLNLAHGFSRGVKNPCVLFFPTAEAVGYFNRRTLLRQNHRQESSSANVEVE